MDLLDFDAKELYFDEACPEKVSELLAQAAKLYSEGEAEFPLLQAYLLAPEDLNVLVGLYRFFYYQHRYSESLLIADRALTITGKRLNLPSPAWEDLTPEIMAKVSDLPLLRFYLLALKGAAYLNLRLDKLAQGRAMLEKLIRLDPEDRLGASALLQVVNEVEALPILN